jgi:D-tagatose-1,6-bisphosphate aldolase subunit GatZ/KbaZ
MKSLLERVAQHKAGAAAGVYSVCSAHPTVLEAALQLAAVTGQLAVIEATSNQVNQEGGYTGMRPAAFRDLVYGLADRAALPHAQIVLGGDHLGPNAWQRQDAATALAKAGVMVSEYVTAGFRKIHLDCSMSCADDPRSLGDALIAERTAQLCALTEAAWRQAGGEPPVYIIGSEVPVPGGAHETLTALAVTTPEAAHATLEAHRVAFRRAHLEAAWERVIGLVVQPGVEFDHHQVIDYQRAPAQTLSRSIERVPGVVFEAHSTDYQTRTALKALVEDHFAILKVGPGVTFALREALWALSDIAMDLKVLPGPSLKQTLLELLKRHPQHWQSYYAAGERLDIALQYSLSDRIRYYWAMPEAQAAVTQLLERLSAAPIPLPLLSQYLPHQYAAIRGGTLAAEPRALLLDSVAHVLRDYAAACTPAAPAPLRIDARTP